MTGQAPQYNGNISYITYYISGDAFTPSSADMQDLPGIQPAPTNTMGYSYAYDGANRLTLASFEFQLDGEWGQAVSYGDTVAYDGSGNITGLTRYGDNAALNDNLTYSYRPGTDLDTLITNSAGAGAAYTYDSTGNVISDSRDSVGFILYDIYNHPVEVYDTNGDVIQYGYDANGARVDKQIGSSYNCYIRGKDGHTDVILLDLSSDNDIFNTIANGDNIAQVDWTNQLFSHYYYIKDHLGDVRMIMDESGNPQVWNNYYPFGKEMPGLNIINAGPDPRFQFTSKELDAETGLYYFGARYYDAWSGRWMSVDPLASKYPGWSPYNYGTDNPLLLIDINGDSVVTISGQQWIQPTAITVTPENQGQISAFSVPSLTTKLTTATTNLSILTVKSYLATKIFKGASPIGFTIGARFGNLESTTYKSPGGETTTLGTNGSWTVGFSSFAVGETSNGRYIIELSTSTGHNTRTGTTLYIDNPTTFAEQAARGLHDILNKIAPSSPLPMLPLYDYPIIGF